MDADLVHASDREPSASAGSSSDVEEAHDDSSVASRGSSRSSSGSISVSFAARGIRPPGETVQIVIEPGFGPPVEPTPVSRSPSPVSLRSWSVSISTASSDEIEYDNYTDDDEYDEDEDGSDVSGASPRRPKQSPLPASPFDFGSAAAPARPKGTKVSSAGRKAGGGKRGKSADPDRASSTSPAGSSSSNALGSTVIRLVPASVDIFQTLLDLGPAPRSRSSSTGNANGGGSISGVSGDGLGLGTARSERSINMPTPTEEEQAKGTGTGGGVEDSDSRPMASLAVPEMTDDDQTSDEIDEEGEDDLENAEAGLLNLARLGCRVQFASTVVDNERSVGADGSGAGPSGVAKISE